MGEWNRARDAVHQAVNDEERDKAIDRLWKLARESAFDDANAEIERIMHDVDDMTNSCQIALAWARASINRLRGDD